MRLSCPVQLASPRREQSIRIKELITDTQCDDVLQADYYDMGVSLAAFAYPHLDIIRN